MIAFRIPSGLGRQQELGLRMALGATRGNIVRLVMWSGMKLVLLGIVCGVVGCFALTRLMTSLLYRVNVTDPLIFTAMICFLALVATLACWWPARRAAQIDPVITLRFG